MKKILSLVLAVLLAAAVLAPSLAADTKGTTIRLGATQGKVTVRNASAKEQSARKDMRLYNGYSVQTASASSAYLTLDDTKAARLDSSSKTEVKKSGKQLELKLVAGKLYFGVTQPLSSDESLNICTSTMVTGIRGSYGWVTQNEMGLLHGHVTLTCRNPYTGEVRVTEVTSGQIVRFDPKADGSGAEPILLEIDFIKRLMTNSDVPALAIEELRQDSALQQLLNEDVENLSVPVLLGLESEKRAAQEKSEAEAEAAIAEAMAEQDAAISGAEQYYEASPEITTSYYTVTLPQVPGDYEITVNDDGAKKIDATHWLVTAGGNVGLTFTCDGTTRCFGPQVSLPGVTAQFTRGSGTDKYTSYTASVVVDQDIDLGATLLTPVYRVSSEQDDLASSDPVAVSGAMTVDLAGLQIAEGKQVLVTSGGSIAFNADTVNLGLIENEGAIISAGDFTNGVSGSIKNAENASVAVTGGTFTNEGSYSGGALTMSGGGFINDGEFEIDGAFENDGGGTFLNSSDCTAEFNGTFTITGGTSPFNNHGTAILNGTVYSNGYMNNYGKIEFNGDVTFDSAFTNSGEYRDAEAVFAQGHTVAVNGNINNSENAVLRVKGTMLVQNNAIYSSTSTTAGHIVLDGEINLDASSNLFLTGARANIDETNLTITATIDDSSYDNYGSTLTGTGSITGAGTLHCAP